MCVVAASAPIAINWRVRPKNYLHRYLANALPVPKLGKGRDKRRVKITARFAGHAAAWPPLRVNLLFVAHPHLRASLLAGILVFNHVVLQAIATHPGHFVSKGRAPGPKFVDADRLRLSPHFLMRTHSLDDVEVDGLILHPAALRPVVAIERTLVAQPVTRRCPFALFYSRNRVAKPARAALGPLNTEIVGLGGCASGSSGGSSGGGSSGGSSGGGSSGGGSTGRTDTTGRVRSGTTIRGTTTRTTRTTTTTFGRTSKATSTFGVVD